MTNGEPTFDDRAAHGESFPGREANDAGGTGGSTSRIGESVSPQKEINMRELALQGLEGPAFAKERKAPEPVPFGEEEPLETDRVSQCVPQPRRAQKTPWAKSL
jgi:hypothetical protein